MKESCLDSNDKKHVNYKINTSFSNDQYHLWKHIMDKILPTHFDIFDNIQNVLTMTNKKLFLKATEIESKIGISYIENNDIDTILELTDDIAMLVDTYMYVNALTVWLSIIQNDIDGLVLGCEKSNNQIISNFNHYKDNLIDSCKNYIIELKITRSKFKSKTIDKSKRNSPVENKFFNIYDNNDQEIRLDKIIDGMDELVLLMQDILTIIKKFKKIEELI